MDEILKKLEEIEHRLTAVESRLQVTSMAEQREELPAPPMYRSEPQTDFSRPSPHKRRSPSDVFVSTFFGAREKTQGVARMPRKDMEAFIGKWWLGIAGVIAVLFGVSFFLKYAFENNLIGETGRIVLGLIAGVGLIGLGEWLRPKFEKYSWILTGGGFGVLYLTIYAAFQYYQMIGQSTAFGFMILVTITGITLSILVNAEVIAGLAIIGGLLTPSLTSTGVANDTVFFAYLGLLSLGIFMVSFFKKWQHLMLLGFIGMMFNFLPWYDKFYTKEKLTFTIAVLGVFYLIYLAAGVIANIATRQRANNGDLFLFTINPAWFFGWGYALLYPEYEHLLGFFAAALSACYIFFAYLASTLASEDRRLILSLAGIAVIFLTIAVPLQLDGNAITIAWAAEGAVLFLLGLLLQEQKLRFFGFGILFIALIRLFAFDSREPDLLTFIPVLNRRFLTYVMTIAAVTVMGYGAMQYRAIMSREERFVPALVVLIFNLLFLGAITMEISTFFSAKLFYLQKEFAIKQQQYIPRHVPPLFDNNERRITSPSYQPSPFSMEYDVKYRSLTNQRNASISVFWTLYAIGLITIGIVLRNAFIRWLALSLFGITTIKVFLFDLASLKTPYRIISFTVLGVLLLLASYLYFRYQKSSEHTQQI